MNESEAQKFLLDVEMRRGLFSLLWSFRMKKEARQGLTPQPMPPNIDDDQIKKELKRIILGK